MYRHALTRALHYFAAGMSAALLAAGAPAYSAEPAYTLSIIARTGTVFAGKNLIQLRDPVIGNNGRIAFWGGYTGGWGIFGRYGLLVKNGDVINGRKLILNAASDLLPGLGINSNDEIVFAAAFAGGQGIFTQTALIVKTGDVIGGSTLLDQFQYPVINASGQIAFLAHFAPRLDNEAYPFGVFMQDRAVIRAGEIVGGQYVAHFVPPTPSIDNHGRVSITFMVHDDIDEGTVVFVSPSQIVAKSGDVVGGKTIDKLDGISLSGVGKLVFQSYGFFTDGVFTRSALFETDVIDGETIQSIGPARVNDAGTVAFWAELSGGEGIFTQDRKVVTTANLIANKKPRRFGPPAINNQENIVFWTQFADGSSGIVLAKPVGRAVNVNPGLE